MASFLSIIPYFFKNKKKSMKNTVVFHTPFSYLYMSYIFDLLQAKIRLDI